MRLQQNLFLSCHSRSIAFSAAVAAARCCYSQFAHENTNVHFIMFLIIWCVFFCWFCFVLALVRLCIEILVQKIKYKINWFFILFSAVIFTWRTVCIKHPAEPSWAELSWAGRCIAQKSLALDDVDGYGYVRGPAAANQNGQRERQETNGEKNNNDDDDGSTA